MLMAVVQLGKKEREEEEMEEDKAQYRTAGNKSGSRNITNK